MNLLRFPFVKSTLKSRYPQLAIMVVLLAGFIFAIVAGFIGTPVGNRNFAIVFVWIAWWAILILGVVPLFGRGWCAVCPIPLPGEWLQRGAVLNPPAWRPRWLSVQWPKLLRNIWLQNITFLLLALFSSVLLTTPHITAIILTGMLFLALGLSVVFERRAFCRYLCPVGGFIGLYSQTNPIELRVQEKRVCAQCKSKFCYNGSAMGYGCPWGVFPAGLTKNTYCGLCMECLRACPNDNLALNLRPFGADLAKSSFRWDEAYKAFIMLGSALVYAAVLLGPWGSLKDAAYRVGTPSWWLYALVFLMVVLVLLPAFFLLATRLSIGKTSFTVRHTSFISALIPLGLVFWVAFSLSFIFTNASNIFIVLSDPLGLGWNLFGTAHLAWHPLFTDLLAPVQTLTLIGGLIWSANTARRTAASLDISLLPILICIFLLTALMLWLLL